MLESKNTWMGVGTLVITILLLSIIPMGLGQEECPEAGWLDRNSCACKALECDGRAAREDNACVDALKEPFESCEAGCLTGCSEGLWNTECYDEECAKLCKEPYNKGVEACRIIYYSTLNVCQQADDLCYDQRGADGGEVLGRVIGDLLKIFEDDYIDDAQKEQRIVNLLSNLGSEIDFKEITTGLGKALDKKIENGEIDRAKKDNFIRIVDSAMQKVKGGGSPVPPIDKITPKPPGGKITPKPTTKSGCKSNSDCKLDQICDIKTGICKSPQCTSDRQCEDDETCSENKCKKAFIVVVVPLGVSEMLTVTPPNEGDNQCPEGGACDNKIVINETEFYYKFSKDSLNIFRDASPLREVNNSLRVHYVEPSICSEKTNCSVYNTRSCDTEAFECAKKSGLIGVANRIVTMVGQSIGYCGLAFIGGFFATVRLAPFCENTTAHELGHTLGLNHIEPKIKPDPLLCGEISFACEEPNADDCNEPNAHSDMMSYCEPRNHFGPKAYSHMKKKYFSKYIGGS